MDFEGIWLNIYFLEGYLSSARCDFIEKKYTYLYKIFLFLGMFGFGLKIFQSLTIRTLVDLILTPKVFQLREKMR